LSAYQIEEGLVRPARIIDSTLPAELRDLFSPSHCAWVRKYLKQELGSENCDVFRNGILLPIQSRRTRAVVDRVALVWVFDDLDLRGVTGRPSRLYHVLDETDDALGLISSGRVETLWFRR
jgi:hypothetical protein